MGRAEPIIDSAAHARAADRLLDARGSIYAAFDSLGLFTHEQALDYFAGSPHFQSLPEDQRWKVAGMCMGFALTIVEQERGHAQ